MTRRFKQFGRMGAGVGVASLVFAALAVSTPQAAAQDWSRCLEGSSDTQAVFARAAQASGVPQDVLLAVGYLSSRWSNNDGAPSTSGGYGVMHLTDFAAGRNGGAAKGDTDRGPGRAGTMRLAADLTSFTPAQLRADHVANICGGAAVLASYQPGTTSQQPADWTEAVARYAGTAEEAKIVQYTGQVFDVLRSGATETTDLGDTVTLAAQADAQPDRAGLEAAGALEPGIDELECPDTIECEAIEALYVQTDTTEPIDPRAYVNYDLADRENDVSIDYLVVHDTECDYEDCVRLIQTPDRFVSWQYTIRSADGHVAQHVATHNVAAHAGNWYINMHSIGLEHEGYAAGQGRWYTDALYRSSAELGKYLAAKYGFELDRAHVVGHEEFQSANYKWDPGPYWDWERYMELLGAPIRAEGEARSQIVTVKPGYEDNQHEMECPADPTGPQQRAGALPAGRHQLRLPAHRPERVRAARRRRRLRRRGPQQPRRRRSQAVRREGRRASGSRPGGTVPRPGCTTRPATRWSCRPRASTSRRRATRRSRSTPAPTPSRRRTPGPRCPTRGSRRSTRSRSSRARSTCWPTRRSRPTTTGPPPTTTSCPATAR